MSIEKQLNRYRLLGIIIIFSSNFIFAQGPDTLWTKTYGGTGQEQGYSVQQTFDGGYIIVGHTSSFGAGGYDIYLIKTDENGDTLWTKTYGGTNADQGYGVQQTSDSGYILVGHTDSYGGGLYDIYLIKTNANGDTIWTKTYGGINRDEGRSVQQTSDGGYIITGGTQSFGAGNYDVYIIKTDANGDTMWTKVYGGTELDIGLSIREISDHSGYILVGETTSFGSGDYNIYVLRTDANGDSLWFKPIGEPGDEHGYSIYEASSGRYIIAGSKRPIAATSHDAYLLQMDDAGETIWEETYGGLQDDQARSVVETSDGGYIVAGYSNSYNAGNYDAYLLKTDITGNKIWEVIYGGPDEEKITSVIQTTDDKYVITGNTMSFGSGGNDIYLIKTGFFIDSVWTHTYGGAGNDIGYAVQETSDNGYIIVGKTNSFGLYDNADTSDVYLINTDSDGNVIWTQTYGGAGDDGGYSVNQTTDGGYIITGYTTPADNRDLYLIKTDDQGDTTWAKTYGSIGDDEGYQVYQTIDGGYIITGYTTPVSDKDLYLIKTDDQGDTTWAKTYSNVGDDEGHSVYQTIDGGYIITGYTTPAGDKDVYLIKTNDQGDTLWAKIYSNTGDDEGHSVYQTTDGGYIITGYINPIDNDDVYLIKTDSNGNVLWKETYGGQGDDRGYSVYQTADGGYIITGYSNSFSGGDYDVYLIRTDGTGTILGTDTYGGPDDEKGYSLYQTFDGGYIITGYTNSFGAGNDDVYLIKTEPDEFTTVQEQNIPTKVFPVLRSMPNPFKEQTKITYVLSTNSGVRIDIYNLLGQKVRTLFNDWQNAGVYEILWDGRDNTTQKVSCGIYFLKLSVSPADGQKNTFFGKLLLIK
jgi:hypothetical protein